MGVDEVGVDGMGSNRSGTTPLRGRPGSRLVYLYMKKRLQKIWNIPTGRLEIL